MSLSLGNTSINGIYLGNTKIGSAYLGNTLVYQSIVPPHKYNYYWLDMIANYVGYNQTYWGVRKLKVNNQTPNTVSTYLYDSTSTIDACRFIGSLSAVTCYKGTFNYLQDLFTDNGYNTNHASNTAPMTIRFGFTCDTIPVITFECIPHMSIVLYGSDTPYISDAVKLSSRYCAYNVLNELDWKSISMTQNDNTLLSTPYTLRFFFSNITYDPTTVSGWKSGSTWTRVSSDPNIWDYTHETSNWDDEFNKKFTSESNEVIILAAGDLSGITSMKTVVYASGKVAGGTFGSGNASNISYITYICDLNTPNVTNMDGLLFGCRYLAVAPKLNTSSCTSLLSTFDTLYCTLMIPDIDMSHVTNMRATYSKCFSLLYTPDFSNVNSNLNLCQYCFERAYNLTDGLKAAYDNLVLTSNTNHASCFSQAGSKSTTGATELAQIPTTWGGTMK